MTPTGSLITISHLQREIEIEYQLIAPERADKSLIVFLHEGLGSVSMWRDYPRSLCDECNCRGLVYSRPGYGASTPRASDQPLRPDFMHVQAHQILPAVLKAIGIDAATEKPWLFGHSDGGSIALLYGAQFPDAVGGLIVVAPHVFVEALSVSSIAKAKIAFERTDLKQKLARHHKDVESAFRGWNDIWLSDEFRHWNIEREVAGIQCAVLAIQGEDDEYGTKAQIDSIARLAPQTKLLKIANCGHSPHRDQAEALSGAVVAFIRAQLSDPPSA